MKSQAPTNRGTPNRVMVPWTNPHMANVLISKWTGLAWAMELVTRTHHRPSLTFSGELTRFCDRKRERGLLIPAAGLAAVHWRKYVPTQRPVTPLVTSSALLRAQNDGSLWSW